jgi:hypothetical protein
MSTRQKSNATGLVIALTLAGVLALPAGLAGAGAEMDSTLTGALAHLGFNEYDSMEIINRSMETEDVTSFRFAASLDPATIDEDEAPWGYPARIGVTWVTWTDPSTVPAFPESPEVIDGVLYLPRGGPVLDTNYVLMWAQMRGPIPIEEPMDLFQNWSFPFGIPGQPTWNPISQYPQDTWGGASVIPYITYGPQPWSFDVSVVQEDGSLLDSDFNGFALIYGDTIFAAVEEKQMFSDSIDGITYSYAGHIHDGTYGASESSRSLVTFATGTPGNLVEVPPTGLLVVGSGTPPPTPTTQATTTTTIDESASGAAVTTAPAGTTKEGTAQQPETTETESGGFPWWILALVGLIAVVIGGRLFIVSKKDPCADLLIAWRDAQDPCDEARVKEKEAKEDCDEATEHRKDLESKLRNLRAEWPPAFEGEGASAELSGQPETRVTSRDLHARSQALGRLWDEYQAGDVSAQEVEQAWERANTPEFRDEMRRRTEAKIAEREQLEKDIENANSTAEKACDQHAKAKEAADEACEKAEKAKKGYDDCLEEQNAEAFKDAVMTLGTDSETAAPSTTATATVAATAATAATTAAPSDPIAARKIGVSLPFVLDQTGLSGDEAERARRLERIFEMRKGGGDIAAVAMDLYQFNQWHIETFDEPWFTWSTAGGDPGSVTTTASHTDTFMQTRVLACYEFVHFAAYIASDQLGRQRIGGDDDEAVLLDEYSVDWGFPDAINTNTTPLEGEAPRGSVITGVFRWGYNNSAGYYHTGVSVGDGKIISLGSDGLILEDATGTVGGAFPSVGYSEVNVGDYRYSNSNPAPASGE